MLRVRWVGRAETVAVFVRDSAVQTHHLARTFASETSSHASETPVQFARDARLGIDRNGARVSHIRVGACPFSI
jgi:hypothetical protein